MSCIDIKTVNLLPSSSTSTTGLVIFKLMFYDTINNKPGVTHQFSSLAGLFSLSRNVTDSPFSYYKTSTLYFLSTYFNIVIKKIVAASNLIWKNPNKTHFFFYSTFSMILAFLLLTFRSVDNDHAQCRSLELLLTRMSFLLISPRPYHKFAF